MLAVVAGVEMALAERGVRVRLGGVEAAGESLLVRRLILT